MDNAPNTDLGRVIEEARARAADAFSYLEPWTREARIGRAIRQAILNYHAEQTSP